MLHFLEPTTGARISGRAPRSPAVPVVCAVAAGILVDSFEKVSFPTWWIATLVVLAFALTLQLVRWTRSSVVALLLGCLCLGGGWHHWCFSCISSNDISTWATDEGRLVRILAKVLQKPLIREAEDKVPWKAVTRTSTVIECRAVMGVRGGSRNADGRARLTIDGRIDEMAIGDVIEVTGMLIRPAEASNPGEFDTRRWMRTQGLHATLAVDNPEAVLLVDREWTLSDEVRRRRDSVRHRAERLIEGHVSTANAGVAQSLLLGSRVDLDRELRRSFAESGTLHVLAISGMNVGLLWGLMWLVCRMLRYSSHASLIAALVLLPGYAVITDANPPIVRATIVATVMVVGQLARRSGSHWNSLALAGLFVLAWNPTDLFNSGAQLSFIAVWTILITMGMLRSLQISFDNEDSITARQSLWNSARTWVVRATIEGFVVSLMVWVVTSPLIASQFHLVSPVGVLLNVVLTPLIALMFWLGYLFLLLGMISSFLFGWLGWLFDATLTLFLWAVQVAAKLPLGHNYVAPPPLWWLIGFYVLLISLTILDQWRGRVFWSVRAILAWSVIGLACSLRPGDSKELTCTVVSVGHGLSVFLEMPDGHTMLYDAGSMTGGGRAAATIQNSIWSTNHSRLDAIVISHADSDHCNAIPDLLKSMPARTLFMHKTCLDWTQPPVAAAIESSTSSGMDIRLVAAGQRIVLDPKVEIDVLHPLVIFDSHIDNANSLVLRVKYAGRKILLTGDLEREGLVELLRSKSEAIDVLLAPHHGSLSANTTDLTRWATPDFVVASCSDPAIEDRLKVNSGPQTEILTTARHGAIRFRIRSNGDLFVEPFKQR